jgi:GPH family glycoside/pentoside/hexuronide:cation symporter
MKSPPLQNKLCYAASSLGSNLVFQALAAWLVFFYSPPTEAGRAVLIPIATIGLLLGIGRFIEAFDDPAIGWLSDRTSSKWGRRTPFIFLATPFIAIFFALLFAPPQNQTQIFYIFYFFIILQLFFLAHTISEAPLAALLPEIVKTTKERVEISAYKVVFGVAGAALGLVGTGIVISRFGFGVMGILVGVISALSFYLALAGVLKYQDKKVKPSTLPLLPSMFALLRNNPFLAFSAGLVLFSLGMNLLILLLPFFVTVILGKGATTVSFLTAIVMIVMIASLPLMSKFAKNFGKKAVYSGSMLAVALIFPLLYFIGFLPFLPKLAQAILFVAFLGIPFSAQFLFPNAIMADVCDFDFLKTGKRREALLYSLQDTLQKFSLAASAIIFGLVLQFFGFSQTNPLGLRLMGLFAGMFVFLGFLIFFRYYQLPDVIKSDEEKE